MAVTRNPRTTKLKISFSEERDAVYGSAEIMEKVVRAVVPAKHFLTQSSHEP